MRPEPCPQLRTLSDVPPAALRGLPKLPGGVELFLVTAEGRFGDRWFGAGDLVVCRGGCSAEGSTVLVARGKGRPRMGTVRGVRLFGEFGEACSLERWRPAGQVVARATRQAHGWVVELLAAIRDEAKVEPDLGLGEPAVRGATDVRGERTSVAPWVEAGARGERTSVTPWVEAGAHPAAPQLCLFLGGSERQEAAA